MAKSRDIQVPASRIRAANRNSVVGSGEFVLYWMIANRRRSYNFALQRAVEWAAELRKPLVIVEGLNTNYPWASDRIHAFVVGGMRSNAAAFGNARVTYVPWVQRGKRILEIVPSACVVVSDDYPAFVIPRWTDVVASQCPVLFETVDASCIVPFRSTQRTFQTAASFRRYVQTRLPADLDHLPSPDALADVDLPRLPARLRESYPADDLEWGSLPIDHSVDPVKGFNGGEREAKIRLASFLKAGLRDYADGRNDVVTEHSSRLSPYLHFGHLSSHEVFYEITRRERWKREAMADRASGRRAGWWHMGADAEAFLDQFITWRELGFNRCATDPHFDKFESLPEWALATLEKHAGDSRKYRYTLEQFENAATHDPLWNAAQRQLLREGRIHNYLRMLWGKKILEWSRRVEDALDSMIHLNNKYALDGRDPNSYSGIFWVLGRYDRPWGPERPIFGTVRYMSSENTARKLSVRSYLERYGPR